jgi:small conductance mechanosensitive channel
MPGLDFYTAASFIEENRNWITAAGTVLIAFVIAEIVDRALVRRAQSLGERVAGGELSPVATTRLRLVRRLIFALIVVIGLALAASQFPSVKRVATAVLASSAVLGLVVGFAARATLANAIAGILLAITQPIRIGDLVTFEEKTGAVEDVRLSYTYIRLDDGHRLIVPNELLAQSSIENHTISDPRVQIEVSVWLAPDADLERAIALIEDEEEGVKAVVAEVDKEGVRLSATTWAADTSARGAQAAELRRRWLRELREHGLSSGEVGAPSAEPVAPAKAAS